MSRRTQEHYWQPKLFEIEIVPNVAALIPIKIDKTDIYVLLGHRLNQLPGGYPLTSPGGRIDQGETPAQACVRETREETGWQLSEEDIFIARPPVYVSPGVIIQYYFMYPDSIQYVVDPINMEPDKVESWYWVTISELATFENSSLLPAIIHTWWLEEAVEARDALQHELNICRYPVHDPNSWLAMLHERDSARHK